jgi:transcription-repair coupling factor (superfamily II helicase)
LSFLQTGTNKARLKQTGKMFLLVVDDVKSMNEMHRFLKHMHHQVVKKPETVEAV